MADITVSSAIHTFMQSADQAAMRTNAGVTSIATVTAGSGIEALLATPSSANLSSAITDKISAGASPKALFGDQAVATTSSPSFVSITINGNAILEASSAHIMTLRNGANAQTLRVANTYTSATNYEVGLFSWSANTLRIGTEKGSGGGTARDLVLVTDGTARVTIGATSGNVTTSASILCGAGVRVPSTNTFYWESRSRLYSPADGIIKLSNANENDFTRLQFGGETASYPSLKRNGAGLDLRVANDSAYATFVGLNLIATGYLKAATYTVATLPVAGTAGAGSRAFVSDANATHTAGVGTTVVGGGANFVPVYTDGANWIIG